jgi:hypothetical protein
MAKASSPSTLPQCRTDPKRAPLKRLGGSRSDIMERLACRLGVSGSFPSRLPRPGLRGQRVRVEPRGCPRWPTIIIARCTSSTTRAWSRRAVGRGWIIRRWSAVQPEGSSAPTLLRPCYLLGRLVPIGVGSQRSSKITPYPLRSTTCTTISAAFTRRFG